MPVVTYSPNSTIQYFTFVDGSETSSSSALDLLINDFDETKKVAIKFDNVTDLIQGSVASAKLKVTIESSTSDLTNYWNEFEVHGIDVGENLPTTGVELTSDLTSMANSVTVTNATVDAAGNGVTLEIDIVSFFNNGEIGNSFVIYLQTLQNTATHSTIKFDFSSPQIEADITDLIVDPVYELDQTLDDATLNSEVGVATELLLSRNLEGATLSATAEVLIEASANNTLDDAELVSQYFDEPPILAFVDKTLDDATLDAEGVLLIQPQVDKTLDGATLSSRMVVGNPFILSATLDSATANAKYFVQDFSAKDRGVFPSKIFLGTNNAIFN